MPLTPIVAAADPDALFAAVPPIFRDCVDAKDQSVRFCLDRPFVRDGYAYATDACIAVRVVATEAIRAVLPATSADRLRPFPNAAEPFRRSPDYGGPTPISLPPPREAMAKCSNCSGSMLCECPSCDEAHRCGDCAGTGIDARQTSVLIGHVTLAEHYLRILRRHDAVLYLPDDPHQMVRFVVGEVEGRLMPMKTEVND